jgi:hypothetical protein
MFEVEEREYTEKEIEGTEKNKQRKHELTKVVQNI